MRRGARNVLGASAALLCLGGLLAACGGESGDGHVATGAVDSVPDKAPGEAGGPTGDVRLIPLNGDSGDAGDQGGQGGGGTGGAKDSGGGAGDGRGDSAGATPRGTDRDAPGSSGAGGTEGKPPTAQGSPPASATPTGPSGSAPPSAGTPPGGGPTPPRTERPRPAEPPSGPAVLSVGEPERAPAAKRWCEKVTVTFHNSGGSPVRSGTVTFGTHIIGALGVDWGTVESTEELPAPIEAGRKKTETWPICVDAWRVPLGMHVETRDVSVDWR
ncbi:hypothetical protein [Streptomyces sp. KN37]|uniref:hypothetical protein n=1 Tax=Streptomyces sp. KN37 TaxID=3090667 RepID=UPI002A74AF0B|nr:hypothetical protein [Streptomyces sp. KN37]WPO72751.1 hypothetical protein R9806_19975 [Streptomyces sp. KN37]